MFLNVMPDLPGNERYIVRCVEIPCLPACGNRKFKYPYRLLILQGFYVKVVAPPAPNEFAGSLINIVIC